MVDEKIKNILLIKNLTPSRFAEEIGVQRSSISHILSGRNKPSFDIIQKILRRYPDLGMEWILSDDSITSEDNSTAPIPKTIKAELMAGTTTRNIVKESNSTVSPLAENAPAKEIEKILIFYKDKTFTEYKPS
ncbi:MAG: helix-turn-helix transcriptional regulator [Bacteroidota bacterium]